MSRELISRKLAARTDRVRPVGRQAASQGFLLCFRKKVRWDSSMAHPRRTRNETRFNCTLPGLNGGAGFGHAGAHDSVVYLDLL